MSGNLTNVRKPPCNRTLGIEIECLVKEMNGRQHTYQRFFYVDDDGSISHNSLDYEYKSCEFVSQPLTLSWMHRELSQLNKNFKWKVNESCGIHVHVSRKWLGTAKAKQIYEWIQERDNEDIKQYFGREPNLFCSVRFKWAYIRVAAINNKPKETIEFRGFASGDGAWPHWCIDFVTYLINHAYHLNIEAVDAFYKWWWANEAKKYEKPSVPAPEPVITPPNPPVRRVRRTNESSLGALLREHMGLEQAINR